jgi:hypothetical protein
MQSRDEQEVVGYYEALEIILEGYSDINLEERYIHQMHGILLKYSDKDQRHKGQYKALSTSSGQLPGLELSGLFQDNRASFNTW